MSAFEAALATQQQALDQIMTRHSQTFSESEEKRAEAFSEELEGARQALTKLQRDAAEEVEKRVGEIRRMEKESAGLVGAIGLAGTSERYGEEGKAQKKVADWFRAFTIVFALGAATMAIIAALHHSDKTSAVLSKLGVSLVFGALAAYTARQSGRHRMREERARNLQLELTAFSPFIEPLDEAQQDFERVLMTRKTFGQIKALPEAVDEHTYGPLGPIADKLTRSAVEESS